MTLISPRESGYVKSVLPPEEVKNASGLYNLMRNLGGAIGLAVANNLMIQWNKAHYAMLREAVTPCSPQARAMLERLAAKMQEMGVADPDLATLRQVHGLLMRESEVMTINALFHALGLVFMLALLLMPLVKKVSPGTGAAEAH